MCITLHILKQVKQFYIRVPVQMIHVLALSEWMCEKKIQYKYTMKTNANGLMQAIFLNQAMRIVKYARKFTTGKLRHVHGFL